MSNKIFFDTETTGVDAFNDRIVEIAIVKTDDDLNVIDESISFAIAIEKQNRLNGLHSIPIYK